MALKDLFTAGVIAQHSQICSESTQEWMTYEVAFPPTASTKSKITQKVGLELKKIPKKILAASGLLIFLVFILMISGGPDDPLAEFEKQLGFKLDRETAELYNAAYFLAANGIPGTGVNTKGTDFEKTLPNFLMENPNRTPEERRVIQAAFGDYQAGLQSRLSGIDINSIPEKK